MIFYGAKDTSVMPPQKGDLGYFWINSLQEKINLKNTNCIDLLVFIPQIHGVEGIIINGYLEPSFLKKEGDFIVTNKARIGIGVLTADCVPIVLHDAKNHCIAVVHAGWRGTVGGVVRNALDAMQTLGCDLKDIFVSFGPAARSCCYEVSKDVADQFLSYPWGIGAVKAKGSEYFLDLVLFNTFFLKSIGIETKKIDLHASACTICNPLYCSYRRDGMHARRNVTIAWLGEKPGNSW